MAWPLNTAVAELRQLLHDGPTDKLRHRKAVFGNINGTNAKFKTFEYRRVTNFTAVGSVYPLGVYVNDTIVAPAGVSADDVGTGDFTLTSAPADGTKVTATYFVQYFTDAELQAFINAAASWLDTGGDSTTLSMCLQQAALKYAGHLGYQKLILRMMDPQSSVFRLEDLPKEERAGMIDSFKNLSDAYFKEALKVRDDCYQRSGKQLQPSWGFSQGRVKDPQPKR